MYVQIHVTHNGPGHCLAPPSIESTTIHPLYIDIVYLYYVYTIHMCTHVLRIAIKPTKSYVSNTIE